VRFEGRLEHLLARALQYPATLRGQLFCRLAGPVGPVGQRTKMAARGLGRPAVPRQYHFDLGGFSSLRGYGFKEFSGDRMVLFNAEHWLQGNQVNVGFFADAGSAWRAGEADFDLQVSGGLGLHSGDFRLYVARPIADQTRDLDLSWRFSRAF